MIWKLNTTDIEVCCVDMIQKINSADIEVYCLVWSGS